MNNSIGESAPFDFKNVEGKPAPPPSPVPSTGGSKGILGEFSDVVSVSGSSSESLALKGRKSYSIHLDTIPEEVATVAESGVAVSVKAEVLGCNVESANTYLDYLNKNSVIPLPKAEQAVLLKAQYEKYKSKSTAGGMHVQTQEAKICPYNHLNEKVKLWDFTCSDPDLSFKLMGLGGLRGFVEDCMDFAGNPVRVFQGLGHIEQAVAVKIAELNKKRGDDPIVFTPERDKPAYLMAEVGHYYPGPPPQDHVARKKEHILDSVLLEEEVKQGVNSEGTTPIFMGAVDLEDADQFVKSGHLFKEQTHVQNLFIHGKNSHRLFFQSLISHLKGTKYATLTPRELTKLLIDVTVADPTGGSNGNLWQTLLDSLDDVVDPMRAGGRALSDDDFLEIAPLTDPSVYNFSCRSPSVLNSLVLCFGDKLGVPNLMYCMLENHWKVTDKIVDNVLVMCEVQNPTYEDRCLAYQLAIDIGGLAFPGMIYPVPFSGEPEDVSEEEDFAEFPYRLANGETAEGIYQKYDKNMADSELLAKMTADPTRFGKTAMNKFLELGIRKDVVTSFVAQFPDVIEESTIFDQLHENPQVGKDFILELLQKNPKLMENPSVVQNLIRKGDVYVDFVVKFLEGRSLYLVNPKNKHLIPDLIKQGNEKYRNLVVNFLEKYRYMMKEKAICTALVRAGSYDDFIIKLLKPSRDRETFSIALYQVLSVTLEDFDKEGASQLLAKIHDGVDIAWVNTDYWFPLQSLLQSKYNYPPNLFDDTGKKLLRDMIKMLGFT